MFAAAAVCAAAMIGLGELHPFGNSRNNPGKQTSTTALLANSDLPVQTKAVLISKCADCHSNATRWPVYARIAPGSWFIERDVIEGRKHMNLSNWDQLTQEGRQTLESKILHETKAGEMPPLQYRLLHWNANLTAQDLQSISLLTKDAGIAEADSSVIGDATRGDAFFNRRCTGCHALDANREGPKLRGAFGRPAGKLPGFTYSSALKSSTITWDAVSLNRWLSDTDEFIPGNNMDFRVVKAAERADIIAFLKRTQ